MNRTVRIFRNSTELSTAAADLFTETANIAIEERGSFTVALTGGNSPAQLYQLLASPEYSTRIDWTKVFVFWGDERWVPLDDPRSNAGMARRFLLDHVSVNPEHVHPMWDEKMHASDFALAYEDKLKAHFRQTGGSFDLILLGMGEDGHTASWFPGTEVLNEKERWVSAYYLESQNMYRITLTAPLISSAAKLTVMTFGANKSEALYQVLEGDENANLYPAQLLRKSTGEQTWLVDEAAASKLSEDFTSTGN